MQDFVQHGANLWQASSATSLSIAGSGSISLVCTINRPFLVGATIRLQRVSDNTAYMQGPITAWTPSTGALSFTSTQSSNGAGTAGPWTDWQILALGLQGATGPTGGVGSFNSRTGTVTLTSGDVTGALGFTPAGAFSSQKITTSATIAPTGPYHIVYYDTTAGAITATLPAPSASANQIISFIDTSGATNATKQLILAPNGGKIMGQTSNTTWSSPNKPFSIVNNLSANDWRLI
jgi:hypothetical protein